MNLIKILQENRLMKTPQEINIFEETLEKIAQHPNNENLKDLHIILDDNCQHPEIMFSLVHFLEDFELQKQIQVFIEVIPQLMITAPEWTKIIHYRIINDESTGKVYQNSLELVNQKTPHFLYQLLLESVKNHLNLPSGVVLT
ncbi:Imm30 family immunity protein [Okeania sp.]|uniref:Imm30 family immunity protein n=1 Tax=Okeania sp. TaxID=3100323 RepID=UPI002B4B2F2A|nr:Imm30 family immunity protein [Okeania sp.]MEB3339651.1 Imm30 family immunity protein [Okeania sp.]